MNKWDKLWERFMKSLLISSVIFCFFIAWLPIMKYSDRIGDVASAVILIVLILLFIFYICYFFETINEHKRRDKLDEQMYGKLIEMVQHKLIFNEDNSKNEGEKKAKGEMLCEIYEQINKIIKLHKRGEMEPSTVSVYNPFEEEMRIRRQMFCDETNRFESIFNKYQKYHIYTRNDK